MAGNNWMPRGATEVVSNDSEWMPTGATEVKKNSFLQDMGDQAVTDIKDVGTLAGNVIQPILHPIQTIKGVGNAIIHPIDTAKAIGKNISDKYGSLDKAGTTFVEHPFSEVLSDAMAVTGGAGLTLKGAGAVSKVGALSKAGDTLTDLSIAPINGVLNGVSKGIEDIKNIGKSNIENRIFGLYNEAVGAKLKNVGEINKIKPQRINAMKAISDNSDNLQLPSGERVPDNRWDLVHGFKQTKQAIWEKVNKLSGGATEAGAKIDITPIVQKSFNDTIKSIGEDALKADPGLLKSIQQEAINISKIGITTPSRAQKYMASLNKELVPSYAAGKGTNFSVLDFKRSLVNHLNDATEASIEDALKKSGYGDLRDQYAALKSSEKEILAAANKYLKQEGGQGGGISHPIVNLWSIEEAMQAAGHIVTGNIPAAGSSLFRSAAIKAASKLADFMKNPDRKISKMFKLLEDYKGGIKPGSSSVSVNAQLMPKANNIPVNNQPRISGGQPLGLPEPFNGRSGIDPTQSYQGQGKLPSSGSIAMPHGGPSAPLGLPDKSIQMGPTTRTGINPDVNTKALPYGQSGPVINQGTSYKPPFDKGVTSRPKYGTKNALELYYKDKAAQENNFIHPSKEARLQSEKFDTEYHTESPKAVYKKEMDKYQESQYKIEYYKEQLKSQIEQRKFLSKSIHPKEFAKSEIQDVERKWIKGNDNGNSWETVASNFNEKFPGVLNQDKHLGDALREYTDSLGSKDQEALRSLISKEKNIKKPNKLK